MSSYLVESNLILSFVIDLFTRSRNGDSKDEDDFFDEYAISDDDDDDEEDDRRPTALQDSADFPSPGGGGGKEDNVYPQMNQEARALILAQLQKVGLDVANNSVDLPTTHHDHTGPVPQFTVPRRSNVIQGKGPGEK